MRKLIWLDSAINDLVRLREFIAKENLEAARHAASGYILRYRVYEDSIYIVHIRHYRDADFKN